jgi:hypothetical protein
MSEVNVLSDGDDEGENSLGEFSVTMSLYLHYTNPDWGVSSSNISQSQLHHSTSIQVSLEGYQSILLFVEAIQSWSRGDISNPIHLRTSQKQLLQRKVASKDRSLFQFLEEVDYKPLVMIRLGK